MARYGVTYQQVAAAADSIVAAGENPTIKRVHAELGSGSHGTIHRHLTTWRNAAPVQERKAPELPAELQAALVKELERQAAESRADAEKRLMQIQDEAAELAAAGEKLEAEMDELEQRNQQLSDENQRLSALADARQSEIEMLQDIVERERQAAEAARIEVAKVKNRMEDQSAQLKEFREHLAEKSASEKSSYTDKVKAEQEAAVAEAKLDSERQVVKELRERLNAMQKQIEADNKDHASELSELRTQVKSASDSHSRELADSNNRLIDALNHVAAMERDLAAERANNEKLMAEVAELKKPRRTAKPAQKKEG